MLILGNGQSAFLRTFDLDWQNFFGKNTLLLGYCGFLLAVIGKQVLVCTANLILFSDVFGRFRHAVNAKLCFKFWVDKTPANGGVINFRGTAKGSRRFG